MAPPQPDWARVLDSTERGPRTNLFNAVLVLQKDPTLQADMLWYDVFLDQIILARDGAPRLLTDEDIYGFTVYMQDDAIGMKTIADYIVKKAVHLVAKQRTRNCVQDYLLSLTWDGIPRIEQALEDHWGVQMHARQPCAYVRAVSRNFFLALTQRALYPGSKVDEMIVFEGEQGTLKSTALEELVRPWHGVAHSRVTEKDFFQDMQGKWLMVVDELDAFSRADISRIKTVISTRVDTYRGSYDARSSDHQRACCLAGTTNRSDWGHDDTGLRRFMPIVVGEINIRSLQDARDQLFAEAVCQLKQKAKWWIYPPSAQQVQADRQEYDEWAALVVPWAHRQITMGEPHVTVTAALMGPLGFRPGELDKPSQMRVGRILAVAGWRRDLLRINGIATRIWVPPPSNQDEPS